MSKTNVPNTITVGRNAINGQFVPKSYTYSHPNTTIIQRIPNPHK